jgi:hypothetical protein
MCCIDFAARLTMLLRTQFGHNTTIPNFNASFHFQNGQLVFMYYGDVSTFVASIVGPGSAFFAGTCQYLVNACLG